MKSSLSNNKTNTPELEEYAPTQFEMWRFYWNFIRIDWFILIGFNIQWLIESILHTRAPFLLLDIKNSLLVIDNGNKNSFLILLVEFIITHLILQFFSFVQVKFTNRTTKMVQQNIQKQIIDHLFTLDIQFFEENKTSSLHQVILQGSEQISKEIQYGRLFQRINQFIYFASRTYFIYVQNNMILLSVGIVALCCILLQRYFTKRKAEIEKINSKICEFESFALDEVLNNMLTIKTYCQEEKEKKNMESIMQKNRESRQQTLLFQQIISIIQSCSHEMMKIAVIGHAFYFYFHFSSANNNSNSEQKNFSNNLGEIISNTYCVLFLIRDLVQLMNNNLDDFYESRKKHIGKVMNLFKVKSTINQSSSAAIDSQSEQFKLQGEIIFENVNFSYPTQSNSLASDYIQMQSQASSELPSNQNQEEKKLYAKQESKINVLNNLSFKIHQGDCIGFVGASGGGKTTIIKLIERYYDAQSGNILINGNNIKDIPLQTLRKNIGLVHQEPLFFDNDIEYNITYSCEGNYTKEQLNKVLQISGVNEFILDANRFPLGLKTMIGSKGVKLSTGQKQRIAIARALIIEPKILILDEATSALDAESECTFQKQIEQIKSYSNMTIIIIAHRLSTVFNCNKIFVIQNGAVVEQGNHHNLIQNASYYANLVKCQMNYDSYFQDPYLIHSDSVETTDSFLF